VEGGSLLSQDTFFTLHKISFDTSTAAPPATRLAHGVEGGSLLSTGYLGLMVLWFGKAGGRMDFLVQGPVGPESKLFVLIAEVFFFFLKMDFFLCVTFGFGVCC